MKNQIKKMLMLLLSCVIVLTNPLSVFANTAKEEVNQTKLEEILVGYFSNYLEVQKKLENIDNIFVAESSKLEEYTELHSELSINLYKKNDRTN